MPKTKLSRLRTDLRKLGRSKNDPAIMSRVQILCESLRHYERDPQDKDFKRAVAKNCRELSAALLKRRQ